MRNGMPDALTVSGTAARIERAWCVGTTSMRSLTIAAIGVSCLLATLAVGAAAPRTVTTCWAACGSLLALAALVDAAERRIPNGLLALATVATLLPMCWRTDAAMALRALAGGTLAGGTLMTVRAVRGIGMGDVKMAAVVGMSVGALQWRLALVAIAAAAAGGAGYGLARRRQSVAFGPALWFGWMSALVGLSTGWWS